MDLLDIDDVKSCLNFSQNFSDFLTHWDNFELTYRTNKKPTPKLYDELMTAYKKEELPREYFAHWFDKIERINQRKQCEKINGQYVDLFSARLIKKIHDKLNAQNKEKFLAMPFPVAFNIAWKLVVKLNGTQRGTGILTGHSRLQQGS
ncbi:MAG: hypothetical protein IT410_01285 [Candidatus Doudnabacteria bacterium]|nr:hypothetical protein [Candidatus Doudnabacteria bacterium]